jgi:hypothetical protein
MPGQRIPNVHTTDDGVLLESSGNPLGHLLLHRLVRVHYRLLVDDDLRRVGFGPADPRGYRRRVCFYDDTVDIMWKVSRQFVADRPSSEKGLLW